MAIGYLWLGEACSSYICCRVGTIRLHSCYPCSICTCIYCQVSCRVGTMRLHSLLVGVVSRLREMPCLPA